MAVRSRTLSASGATRQLHAKTVTTVQYMTTMANIFRSSYRFVSHKNVCNLSKSQFARNLPFYQSRSFSDTSSENKAVQETSTQEDSLYRTPTKPLTNYPIAKNFFLGRFDKKQLVFPDVLSKDELEELNVLVQPIDKFFNEELDSKAIDEAAKIPPDVLNTVKELGLFGQIIPQEYGGLGLNATKFARLAEITALDGAIAVTLAAHQTIGLKGILLVGNEQQKQKYLPKLATGEHIAAFALTEPSSGSDAASIQTKATLSPDGKHYLLNGGKIWISNGGIADVFTVFAKTEVPSATGPKKEAVTAFIVERAFGGVTHGKPEDKLGIRGSNTCEVHFENTPVPVENILGGEGAGFKVAMNILNSGRFSMGSSVAGMHRKLIALTAEHAITRSQFNRKLKDFELIQEKFAKMAIRCYAMESMAYMTAGILDSYQQPDASVEAAMVKVFSSEAAWTSISECVQILGGLGYMRDYPFERYLRDSRILLIFEGTNEILRLYIALTGVQFAGNELKDIIQRTKNPLNNVGFMMKFAYQRMKEEKFPSTELYKDLHPTLEDAAGSLEKSLYKFKMAVEQGLSIFKQGLIEEQMYLRRLADMSIDLYAMTAVLARCSRSRSIGLKNCDHEALLAKVFVAEASMRIERNSQELTLGKLNNGDEAYKQIADDIFKNHGYVPESPLERIF